MNEADCGYQVYGNEKKISHLLYMDDLKLLGRCEDNLENEIKIVKQLAKTLL
jgi:hypothetical protein